MKLKCLYFAAVLLSNIGATHAYSAIAIINGHTHGSWRYATNHDTQKEADKATISGCKANAQENGLAKLASQCKIVNRGKGPGYGAVVCGTDGCSWSLSYKSRQIAVDKAYERCVKKYPQCQSEGITFWEDFQGFKVKNIAKTNTKDCRPKTQTLRCTSNCVNGNCVLTYENG